MIKERGNKTQEGGTVVETVRYTIVNIGTVSMNKFWGESERLRKPTATCTLLQAGGKRLLVDPSPDPDLLEPQLFACTGLRPADVDAVFVTHWHGDHRFGLALLKSQPWLMAEKGIVEWKQQRPEDADLSDRFTPAEGRLPEGISLFYSPGHTHGHCSLLADTQWGPLIVSGDAVMTPEFFEAEEGYHNSLDFERAAETIRVIKQIAKLVIPGHGNVIPNM
jgi:glyoxylase-like metal-dependent hydrolase (beta-lactamase superfamily II)